MTTNTDTDFDAISAAVASGDEDALNKLMETQEVKNETDESNDDTESNNDSVESDDSGEGANKESNDSSTEEVNKTEAATAAASTAVTSSDREKELEKELQRYKSDAGRVPYIQRRMAELERELRAYKARNAQPTKDGETTSDVELDEETRREIEELRETDPVLAKTLERVAKAALKAAKTNVDNAVTTLTQAEQEAEDHRFYMEQKQELLREVPNADRIFSTPEWRQWKETLTPGQRAMAESSYANEVKQAIYAFAAAMQRNNHQPANTQVNTEVDPVQSAEADKVKEARNRKVSSSPDVKSASAKKAAEFDEDAYFREMYENVRKENHIN